MADDRGVPADQQPSTRQCAGPLTAAQAWDYVEAWLAAPPVWVPAADEATARVYGALNQQVPITGNLVTDGQLAALAIQRGVELMSADGDFARFPGLRWRNPLAST
ncbi:MAG: hypothetical protein QM733_02005 [Ilumatobacteraceae bacterium]